MADASAGDDGWHLVVAHPATEIREEKQIEEWERSRGHWSGLGKHPTNWADHKTLRIQNGGLGVGSYGVVERVTYRTVTMARKHVKPRGGVTIEKLREEANAMERLVHKHILKLIGTYTFKRNNLFLLLYPVAVCDLSKFLEDIDEIRSGTYADREDAFKRLYALGLEDIGTIEDLAVLRHSPHPPAIASGTTTAVGFLQQILGCITEALAYVHENNIRHRDLKPKNILLSPGRVYLADFGIARDVRESDDSITCGRCGTPSWIAPEVQDEQDHHMSPADVWSLGCIFLNIVTILYGEPLEKYDKIMKERDWTKKYQMLPKYLVELQKTGIGAALRNHDEPNFDAKNVIGLIDDMLKYDPIKRPTAAEVNTKLSELGGLDQIYHLKCCHKTNTYVSDIINRKLKSVYDTNAASLLRISQLVAENATIKSRLVDLESVNSTFQQRIENERKHAGDQYRALKERHDKELFARKALEERLKELELKPGRQQRSQNRSRGKNRGLLHGNPNNEPFINVNINSTQLPGQDRDVGTLKLSRRASRVPLPIRPSTPIRPIYNREPGSSSSTIIGSINSTFSRTSLQSNDSCSSVGSATVRSSPPGSPITARLPSSTNIERRSPASPVSTNEETKRSNHVSKPSWANMVARSVLKG